MPAKFTALYVLYCARALLRGLYTPATTTVSKGTLAKVARACRRALAVVALPTPAMSAGVITRLSTTTG